jgi:hypothetical protein
MARPPRKRELVAKISAALALEEPNLGKGGNIPRKWLKCCTEALGVEQPSRNKSGLASQVAEALAVQWDPAFVVKGSGLSVEFIELLWLAVDCRQRLQAHIGLDPSPFLYGSDLWEPVYELVIGGSPPRRLSMLARELLTHAHGRSQNGTKVQRIRISDYLLQNRVGPLAIQNILWAIESATSDESTEELDEANETESEENTLHALPMIAEGAAFSSEYSDQNLDSLVLQIARRDIDLSPPWQRSDVWSRARQRGLIESLLLGIPLPAVILHEQTDYRMAVIDGKQRLTAISQFVSDTFPLSRAQFIRKSREGSGNPLAECNGRHFSRLPHWAQRKIRSTRLNIVKFRKLHPDMLYRVFELYNTAGTRLNAVEIRNAVYHENPIHQLLFKLSGDNPQSGQWLSRKTERAGFAQQLRFVLGNGGTPARYAATDFLERFLAYSRTLPAVLPGMNGEYTAPSGFRRESTARAIRRYLDSYQDHTTDTPASVAEDVMASWALASDRYDELGLLAFQVRQAGTGKPKFHRLRATTSLTVGRVLRYLQPSSALARKAIQHAEHAAPIRDNQQTRSIWEHQANYVLAVVQRLGKRYATPPREIEALMSNMHWVRALQSDPNFDSLTTGPSSVQALVSLA